MAIVLDLIVLGGFVWPSLWNSWSRRDQGRFPKKRCMASTAKESEGVGDHKEGRARVGKDGQPEAGQTENGKEEKDGLDPESKGDIEADHVQRAATKADGFRDHREVLAHERDVGR